MIPGNINTDLISGADGGYTISRSLRFNSSDSAYLSRTPASAGNRKTWTWAGWVKRSGLSSNNYLFTTTFTNAAAAGFLYFNSTSNTLTYWDRRSSADGAILITNAVFRDASAWYHVVLSVDYSNATPANRAKLYVNGVEQTYSIASYPATSEDSYFNAATAHYISSTGGFIDGYLADVHLVDGQALTPSSFTETDATTGQLIPKAYTGTFGTNGFWLKFSDNSNNTATTLGKDYSGNGNNWTPNNLSVTAGAGNDSLRDSPSSPAGQTDSGAGGTVVGNYATLNPLAKGSDVTLANGNLDCSTSSTAGYSSVLATIGVTSGKWYWEFTAGSGTLRIGLGIATQAHNLSTWLGGDAYGWEYFNNDGNKYTNGSGGAYGASWTTGDVIGVALDADNGTLTFYKNGSSQGQAYSGLTSGPYFPAVADSGTAGILAGSFNFGQRPFAYTAPSGGFKALCTANLPTPTIANGATAMDVLLWSGTGGNRSFSSLSMSPDFVWIKQRNAAFSTGHQLYDIVRGAGSEKELNSSGTGAEGAGNIDQYGWLSSFDSNGFSVTAGPVGADYVNASGTTYAAWCWDAGTNTVTDNTGSIQSTRRTNAASGFSVVTWTGNGATTTQTIGHGLNVSLGMVIVKARDSGSNDMGWGVSHASVASPNYLYLNSTDAAGNGGPAQGQPSIGSGSTFSILAGTAPGTNNFNANGIKYVAYCFAPVSSYSAFGSYQGNGSSDGPFVYTGFRPRFILFKCSSAVAYWGIYDAVRNTYNAVNLGLYPNDLIAELADQPFDFLSNGFKVRGTSAFVNSNGGTYIYAAFAESPFAYARAR